MPKPFTSFFSRRKPQTLPFKDYYKKWFNTLNNTHLPLLHHSLSSSSQSTLLYAHIDLLLHHFLSYYDALDFAATHESLPQLLFPSWRNSLEIPFLFLGDLHPYLFTNLVRSFLDEEKHQETDQVTDFFHKNEFFDRPWLVVMAWKDVPENLIARIDQIERGLRMMVPELIDRMKKVQCGFAGRVAEDWAASDKRTERVKVVVEEAMKEEMEEMVRVFKDANRLRKSVITEIVSSLTVYQAALFFEGLARLLVGFRDRKVVREFKLCKTPIST